MKRKGVAQFGDIVIDFDRVELRRCGQLIPATCLEFKLLRFFVSNPESVFSREELIQAIWPERKRMTCRGVDNSILHLRRKLERNPARPVYFQTVYRSGYKFVPLDAGMKRARSIAPSSNPPSMPATLATPLIGASSPVIGSIPIWRLKRSWSAPPVMPIGNARRLRSPGKTASSRGRTIGTV